jgi:Domain of unknown function (DUF4124)
MLRPLAFTTVFMASLLVGTAGVARADVYRWVDDKGEAHYTDRWVPGSELIKSNRPRPATPESSSASAAGQAKATAATNQSISAKLQQQEAANAVKQDVAKTKDAQCKQAKERYQKAIEARRIYKPGKDGEDRVYMSDSETDAYRLQARNDVQVACGSPPAPVEP